MTIPALVAGIAWAAGDNARTRRADRPRDELAVKLALAITAPGVDAHEVLQTQRGATLRSLRDLTRLRSDAPPDDRAWRLVLESMIFQTEAEVRWLDHCEQFMLAKA